MVDKNFAFRITNNPEISIDDLNEASAIINHKMISNESQFIKFEGELELMNLQETQRLLQQAKDAAR